MTKRWEVKLRCPACGHRYKRVLKAESKEAVDAIPDSALPPCPCCKTAERVRGLDFNTPRAPAHVGGNVHVKAIDETAKIVMEDYKLGDLRSDVRPGETATPKLAPHLQAQADGFFGGRKAAGLNPILGRAAARALSGQARAGTPDVVGAVHKAKAMPPTKFIAGDGIKGGS